MTQITMVIWKSGGGGRVCALARIDGDSIHEQSRTYLSIIEIRSLEPLFDSLVTRSTCLHRKHAAKILLLHIQTKPCLFDIRMQFKRMKIRKSLIEKCMHEHTLIYAD